VNQTSTPTTLPLSAASLRIAVVASKFNRDVSSRLVDGAIACLRRHGSKIVVGDVLWVPGAFELPQAADLLARNGRWDAIMCLGAVIRGETPHFEFVASEAARGIQHVALTRGLPVVFGVVTTDNEQQALDRAGGSHGNKGWDAAATAIDMAHIFKTRRRRR